VGCLSELGEGRPDTVMPSPNPLKEYPEIWLALNTKPKKNQLRSRLVHDRKVILKEPGIWLLVIVLGVILTVGFLIAVKTTAGASNYEHPNCGTCAGVGGR